MCCPGQPCRGQRGLDELPWSSVLWWPQKGQKSCLPIGSGFPISIVYACFFIAIFKSDANIGVWQYRKRRRMVAPSMTL